jgi:REP element-mobilizing transposase RayT
VHWSIQSDHVHLIVEAKDRETLEWGVRSLVIRMARRLNGLLDRHGPVWGDRYHRRDVATPAEVRTLLLYVLANARKHERVAHGARWIDPFSSALAFDGWERAFRAEYAERAPPHLAPHTWLLRVGWKQRWGPIRFDEAPRA